VAKYPTIQTPSFCHIEYMQDRPEHEMDSHNVGLFELGNLSDEADVL